MNDWNESYEAGDMPWDDAEPDPCLVEAVSAGRLPSGRALEVGCGTGTNAGYLAAAGWDVTATDVAPAAIARAREAGGDVTYAVHDVLAEALPGGPYDVVFDRGVFHVFDAASDRARFAEVVVLSSVASVTPWQDGSPQAMASPSGLELLLSCVCAG